MTPDIRRFGSSDHMTHSFGQGDDVPAWLIRFVFSEADAPSAKFAKDVVVTDTPYAFLVEGASDDDQGPLISVSGSTSGEKYGVEIGAATKRVIVIGSMGRMYMEPTQ